MSTEIEIDEQENTPLDIKGINDDIAKGAKAYSEILRNAGRDWSHWSATILGLRGLRSLAIAKAGTSNMQSQAYRDSMGYLLSLRKHAVYNEIDKQTRSDCYRLAEQLEAVDNWYAGLHRNDKLRWRHPSSIVKHCPKHMLVGGLRKHNRPPTLARKKPAVTVESERLKALLLQVIKRLAKFDPTALDLLDQIQPNDASGLNDDLDDFENVP